MKGFLSSAFSLFLVCFFLYFQFVEVKRWWQENTESPKTFVLALFGVGTTAKIAPHARYQQSLSVIGPKIGGSLNEWMSARNNDPDDFDEWVKNWLVLRAVIAELDLHVGELGELNNYARENEDEIVRKEHLEETLPCMYKVEEKYRRAIAAQRKQIQLAENLTGGWKYPMTEIAEADRRAIVDLDNEINKNIFDVMVLVRSLEMKVGESSDAR